MRVRVLIIDNEPRWLDYAKGDLHKFEIAIASDFITALEELKKNKFELVIVSSNYLEVLETIFKKHPSIRAVVVTICPSTREARDAYRFGALRYFPKSFKSRDLFDHVKDAIPNYQRYERERASRDEKKA